MAASDLAESAAGARRPDARTWFYLAAVIVFWGGNWPLTKIALGHVGPLTFTVARVAGTAAVVAIVLLATGRGLLPVAGERRKLATVGLLQGAGMLGFALLGLQIVSAGRGVVLAYTFQLWAMLLGAWLLGEGFGPRKLAAALIGLSGLVVFFNPTLVDWSDARSLLGNGFVLLGAFCWAAGSTLYRQRRWESVGWAQVGWQMLVSLPVLGALAVTFELDRPAEWNWAVLLILFFNCTTATALGYLWWGRVLERMEAGTAGQVLMLTPVFGFLLSAAVFGEPVTLDVVASIALIAGGLMLALGGKRSR